MATWDLQEKPGTGTGFGWEYNEPNLTYDQEEDPDTNNAVYYDSLGIANSWTNINKS